MPENRIPVDSDLEVSRTALLEMADSAQIGAALGGRFETEGVLTVYFECLLAGYPGWRWTVDLVHVDGVASVIETSLTPGDGALLSPDWVPWSERLAEYEAAQALLAAEGAAEEAEEEAEGHSEDQDDPEEDHDDDDHDDDDLFDEDFDGIEIDELDDSVEGEPQPEVPESSALLAVSENEPNEPEREPDDASPEPPLKPRRNQRGKKKKQPDEGE